MCVTMVAMVQRPHATVGAIRRNHICNPQNFAVEFRRSIPNRVVMSSKTNTATISAIILYFVAGKMGLLNQMQANQTAYAVALFLNQCSSTSIWMFFAAAPVI